MVVGFGIFTVIGFLIAWAVIHLSVNYFSEIEWPESLIVAALVYVAGFIWSSIASPLLTI